jgi:hypothetical protein
MTGSFLDEPPVSPPVQALYDEDLAAVTYGRPVGGRE